MAREKCEQVAVRLSHEQRVLIERAAAADSVTLSQFMRRELLKSAQDRVIDAFLDGRLDLAEVGRS